MMKIMTTKSSTQRTKTSVLSTTHGGFGIGGRNLSLSEEGDEGLEKAAEKVKTMKGGFSVLIGELTEDGKELAAEG